MTPLEDLEFWESLWGKTGFLEESGNLTGLNISFVVERGSSALARGGISTLLLLSWDLATPKFASDLLTWIVAPLVLCANPSTADPVPTKKAL